jgi:hypothetical protein
MSPANVLTRVGSKIEIQQGVLMAILTVCSVIVIGAFGANLMASNGLIRMSAAGSYTYLSCVDQNESSSSVAIPQAIINHDPKFYNPYATSTVVSEFINPLGYKMKGTYTDKCYVSYKDEATGTWRSKIVASCSGQDSETLKDCRVQEGYCINAGEQKNKSWSYAYRCINGCNSGRCHETAVGSLRIQESKLSPSSLVAAANQSDASFTGTFKFSASNENIRVDRFSLCVEDGGLNNSIIGGPNSITKIVVGSQHLVPSPTTGCAVFATSTMTVLKDNIESPFLLRAGFYGAKAGVGEPGTSGADLKLRIKDVVAYGVSTAQLATINYIDDVTNPVILYNNFPIFNPQSITGTLNNGMQILAKLMFIIPGSNGEDVMLNKLSFQIYKSPDSISLSNFVLMKDWLPIANGSMSADGRLVFSNLKLLVPDITQVTLEVRANIAGVGTGGETVTTRFLGDSAPLSAYPASFSDIDSSSNFAWSDLNKSEVPTDPEVLTKPQWTNGFLVDRYYQNYNIWTLFRY